MTETDKWKQAEKLHRVEWKVEVHFIQKKCMVQNTTLGCHNLVYNSYFWTSVEISMLSSKNILRQFSQWGAGGTKILEFWVCSNHIMVVLFLELMCNIAFIESIYSNEAFLFTE